MNRKKYYTKQKKKENNRLLAWLTNASQPTTAIASINYAQSS
jgi:hypothetical protein